jgi:hypothetical protein
MTVERQCEKVMMRLQESWVGDWMVLYENGDMLSVSLFVYSNKKISASIRYK